MSPALMTSPLAVTSVRKFVLVTAWPERAFVSPRSLAFTAAIAVRIADQNAHADRHISRACAVVDVRAR